MLKQYNDADFEINALDNGRINTLGNYGIYTSDADDFCADDWWLEYRGKLF